MATNNNSIIAQAGKDIVTALSSNKYLRNLVYDRIYPLIADEGTTFPFVVYRRTALAPDNNKDEGINTATVEIVAVADNYSDGVKVADLIYTTLSNYTSDRIEGIKIQTAYEQWTDNAFLQTIQAEITYY
jgi:hypothetical protein